MGKLLKNEDLLSKYSIIFNNYLKNLVTEDNTTLHLMARIDPSENS